MKRILLISAILAAITLLLGCGDSIVNNPIEVVDNVEVGMTLSQVET